MTRCFLPAGAVLAALTLAAPDVHAELLDAATCGQIKGEQARMEQAGVRGNMARGPEWAKANLASDKLEQIRRLLELDEQLLFRCSARNLVELPPEADAEPAAAPPKGGEDEAKAGTSPKTDAGPAVRGKPSTTKKGPPTKSEVKSTPKKEAKKVTPPPKAPPKVKTDDAFKPPPVNPDVDPFSNQPARQ